MLGQAGLTTGGANPIEYDCNEAPKTSSKKLNDCEKKQACNKIKAINKEMQTGTRRMDTQGADKATYQAARTAGNSGAASFRYATKKVMANVPRGGMDAAKASQRSKFMHKCAHDEWKKKPAAQRDKFSGYQADHVIEIQLGGAPGASNLKYLSSRVNGSFGSTIKGMDANTTGIKAVNCC